MVNKPIIKVQLSTRKQLLWQKSEGEVHNISLFIYYIFNQSLLHPIFLDKQNYAILY